MEEKDLGKRNQVGFPAGSPLGGVDPQALLQAFVMHSHDGSAMGGKNLYGPYFLKDTSDGHTYKLVSTGGVLSLVLVV